MELIESIQNSYSIGVLVLYVNDAQQYEILDGQQRLLTIRKYLKDELDLKSSELLRYSDLNLQERTLLEAYCVYYLKLKSHDAESKEEDIVQTFLRLQEGTPLNKAEKINAYRGAFKDTFRDVRQTSSLFSLMGPDKRFRWRQLSAELLLLELESDFENRVFPSLALDNLVRAIKTHSKEVSAKKVKYLRGNLEFLHQSLSYLLTAFNAREVIAFYLLVSYLRRSKADNSGLSNELAVFAEEFFKKLNSFSMYDDTRPAEMTQDDFNAYRSYKQEAKIQTTPDSIKKRFSFILGEFEKMHPFIVKDADRLHDKEQKRILFFRQKGLCGECGKPMDCQVTSSHHGFSHSTGGRTDDLSSAMLLHVKCHRRLERRKAKEQQLRLD